MISITSKTTVEAAAIAAVCAADADCVAVGGEEGTMASEVHIG